MRYLTFLFQEGFLFIHHQSPIKKNENEQIIYR